MENFFPGKGKVFVVELAYNSLSRWVLLVRVFSKIFCH